MSQGKEMQKSTISEDFFFHFQIIETFGYLEILETDFSLSLSKCFWIIAKTFEMLLLYRDKLWEG